MEFDELRGYPEKHDVNGVLVRVVNALGYRFHWATEGLRPEDYAFSPGCECFTIGQLVGHVWGLSYWMREELGDMAEFQERPKDPEAVREDVFNHLAALRRLFQRTEAEALFAKTMGGHPFWHLINGPLADALTHTGQITSFRRLNGNPVPPHNVFLGYDEGEMP